MIVLSQGPTVHCIVMGRISSHIHLQGRGWQPTLQLLLQKRKHYSNRAPSGVFSVKRTVDCEQTPPQGKSLPCRVGSGLSESVFHRWWTKHSSLPRLIQEPHMEVPRSGRGCHTAPGPWKRRSFLRVMRQEGLSRGAWVPKPGSGSIAFIARKTAISSHKTSVSWTATEVLCLAQMALLDHNVDIAFPRDRAVTPVARRARSVAKRSSCFNLELVLPLCIWIT